MLPSNGAVLLVGALLAAVAFFVWERFAKTRLIEPAGVHFRPFLAALGASLVTGAALMVTLVNVELFGQGVLSQSPNDAAFLLLRFLIALPIGALLGGWIATRIGDRIVACVGLLIAAGGYYLVAQWPATVLEAHHDLGFVTLPMLDTDLVIAGVGLGLVIAPLTSATLRVVPAAQHGIASAAVVVARMIGMLIGVAALSAWGLYKFNQYLQERLAALTPTDPDSPGGILIAASRLAEASRQAYVLQYGDIFKITCAVCVVGAALALLISGRHEHADEPESADDAPQRVRVGSPADDNPTQAIETPTHRIASPAADETARLEQPRGRPPAE